MWQWDQANRNGRRRPLIEAFDRPSGANSNTGQAISGGHQLQAVSGATGAKRATAGGGADRGNTHILALRRFIANVPPTVSMTSPSTGANFTAPANITLSASAADSDGTIQKVEFFHGGANLIATLTAAPYSVSWTGVPQGAYTLTAVATDNQNASTTSAPVNITVNAAVAQLYFVHVDHLNTPRLVANAAGTAVWQWDQAEPFGSNPANETVGGGTFEFPLRFPGQYADTEINLFYNYSRDYDPLLGRYLESDLIGLRGGLNTYAYVDSRPILFFDTKGHQAGRTEIGPMPEDAESPAFLPNNATVVPPGTSPAYVTCYLNCLEEQGFAMARRVALACGGVGAAIGVGIAARTANPMSGLSAGAVSACACLVVVGLPASTVVNNTCRRICAGVQ